MSIIRKEPLTAVTKQKEHSCFTVWSSATLNNRSNSVYPYAYHGHRIAILAHPVEFNSDLLFLLLVVVVESISIVISISISNVLHQYSLNLPVVETLSPPLWPIKLHCVVLTASK